VLKLTFRVRKEPAIELGGLWLGVDEDEERRRRRVERGAGTRTINLGSPLRSLGSIPKKSFLILRC